MAIGTAVTLSGTRPLPLILFAQVANGLLLPVVALFLVGVMNDRRRLGNDVNGWAANLAGIAVVLLCAVLGVRGVMGAFR
ncbi:MAG: hypothetical protein HYY94_01670 [Gemmatimonadetes bacterium]|nr:hypothetical protein [Gemmatimonadota bacterium]